MADQEKADHSTTSHKSFENAELKAKLWAYKISLYFTLSEEVKAKLWYKVFYEIFLSSSMPKTQAYLFEHGFKKRKPIQFFGLCLDVILRGISQVFLCNHPICGILILIGLYWTTWKLPVFALIGTTCSTGSALLVARPPQEDILAGLCGYDGALVGCSCFTFLAGSEAMVSSILLATLSGIVHVAVTNLMKIWQLPSFTFAFNIVMIMMLFAIKGNTVALHFSSTPAVEHNADFTTMSWQFAIDATIRGVGQFMFASTTVGSAFVIGGIAVCSRKGAVIATLGSVVGWLLAFYVFHVRNVINVRSGLYGYNCAGTCSVLAGGIFYKASDGAVLVGVCGACLASLLALGFAGMFDGLPVLTFPFITSAWIVMLSRSKWLDATSDGLLRPLMKRISSKQIGGRNLRIPMLDYYPKMFGKSPNRTNDDYNEEVLQKVRSSSFLQRFKSNSQLFSTPQKMSRVNSTQYDTKNSDEDIARMVPKKKNSFGSFSQISSKKLSFKDVAKAIVEVQKEMKNENDLEIGQVYRFDEKDDEISEGNIG